MRGRAAGRPARPRRRRRAFGLAPGLAFDPVVAEAALGRVRALPGVRDATYRLALDRARRSLTVTLRLADGAPGGPSGILAGQGSAASRRSGATSAAW